MDTAAAIVKAVFGPQPKAKLSVARSRTVPGFAAIAASAAAAALAPAPTLASAAPQRRPATAQRHATAAQQHLTAAQRQVLRSNELWATIDVCDPSDQPNTLGVRGSMPGDRHAGDRMFMQFRVQYQEGSRWVDLASDARAPWVPVGRAGSSRQDGSSFQITPVTGRPAFALRGVVQFQWRRAGKVWLSVSRATSAGHKSLAGADPAGFSAATCSIG
ncbi:MAG TPA: hypothetical protein VFW29_12885 [Solirubrobacteraceae bacterium]|nr:hypothetical protein [Solirubrobacteraceae bacterium]